jgi:ABC-2 type transport system permease protein
VAAHVLRLRLALLIGALRGDARHIARVVTGLAILVAGTVAVAWAVLSLADADDDVVLAVTVLGGSGVVLGYALAPLMGGVTDPLDPRRFGVFGLPPVRLAAVLGLVGFVSVPTLVLVVVAGSAAVMWSAHGVPLPAALLGALLFVVTCVLLARVATALAAMFLDERRSRELSGLFALAILVIVVPVGVFLSSLEWDGVVPTQVTEAMRVLAVTPLGAAVAFPGLVHAGAEEAWLSLLVALAAVAVLTLVWGWLVRRALTTTERPVAGRERGGLGWFAVAPGTPAGAVAARSLLYWFGDRRYLANVVIIPVAAAFAMLPLLIAGVPLEIVALVPVPLIALFLGWLPHNDLAYDSTAIWMHIASALRGISDRLGRLVPVLLIGVPLLAIAVPVAVSVHGRWAILPAMIGVCASLFLTGLGLSSFTSAAWPYAVSRPGDSPFQQPQRAGAGAAIAQAFVMLGALALSSPALWWGWLTLTRDTGYGEMTLWGGLGIGAAVLIVGIAAGSAVFERRGSRIMEFAEST